MKIVLTSHHYFPHVGGTEKVVKALATRFVEAGHKVTIYSDYQDLMHLKSTQDIIYKGVKLHRIGKFRIPEWKYAKKLKNEDLDILHVQGQRVWSSDYLYFSLNKIKAGKIFTPHGFYQIQFNTLFNRFYYYSYMPRFLNKFDYLIALTDPEKDLMVKMGIDKDKIITIPDPIDFEELDQIPNENVQEKFGILEHKVLLNVGGFYRNKNLEFIINALEGIKDSMFLIVGEIYDRKYKEEIENLAIMKNVNLKILGKVNRKDLINLMRFSDAFLFSSTFEGFGLVLVEAAYLNVPIISTPVGIASDLAKLNFASIVTTTEDMKYEILKNQKKTGNTEVLKSRFSIEYIGDMHLKLYEKLVKNS